MGLVDMLKDLWKKESSTVVHGWIPRDGATYGPSDEGRNYLSVSCSDVGIRFERERFGDRLPVLQSLITWPSDDQKITVSSTLGPSSFTALNEGEFARLVHRDVALTGDLPMNADAVHVVVGLIAAPGESLLDQATDFLGDLATLTQVPQLTMAAPVAAKIAQGVDKLLGNEDTRGLIALQTSIQADRLRDGYLVVTDWLASEGSLDQLVVTDSGLKVREPGDPTEVLHLPSFSFIVLDVQVTPSKPQRWRELTSVSKLAKTAVSQLAKAKSTEDVDAAGNAAQVAMNEVLFEPNLTVADRDIAAAQILSMWEDAVARRNAVLHGEGRDSLGIAPQRDEDESDESDGAGERKAAKVISAADIVSHKLKRMRQSAR